MSIVSSSFEYSTNLDGSRAVVERHTDQDGKVYTLSWLAPAAMDIQARVTARIAELDASLAEAEMNEIVGNP